METEDFVFDEGGEGEVVEEVGEEFPDVGGAIFSQTLIIKTINLGDLPAFVVPSKNGNAMWKSNLQRHKKRNCFHGKITSIDIISHEKIVGVGAFPSNSKQFGEIVKLAVNVSADCHWEGDWLNV